jgi:thiol-disulfide isomerase/thioredoxin
VVRRVAIFHIVFLSCAPVVGSGGVAAPGASPVTRGAAAAADLRAIELCTLGGEPTRLADAVAGRVALVSLWATWCTSCQQELPALARLEARLGQRARVVAVAVGEPRGQVARFVAERGLSWAQLVDERFHLADALRERRVPATLVLDREGRIVYRGGGLDEPALDALRRALAQAEAAPAPAPAPPARLSLGPRSTPPALPSRAASP